MTVGLVLYTHKDEYSTTLYDGFTLVPQNQAITDLGQSTYRSIYLLKIIINFFKMVKISSFSLKRHDFFLHI